MPTDQQNIKKLYLSESANGSPIEVNSTSKSTPTKLHASEEGALDYTDCVFMKASNSSNAPVLVHLHWNPETDDDAGIDDVALTYQIPAYTDQWLCQGEPLGGAHFAVGNARAGATARVESGDTNKIRIVGYVNRLQQPGV